MIKLIKTITTPYTTTNLHPYLLHSLQHQQLTINQHQHQPITINQHQQRALELFSSASHLCINAPERSGKTLAYLIPIINNLLTSKSTSNQQSGALIITLNKQLVLQVYTQIRRIDPQHRLVVNRCGSITHYSPVIEQLCKAGQSQDEDMIISLMDRNVAASVKWTNTDILISTPETLFRILEAKLQNKERFAPEVVVIDEADIILNQNHTLFNYLKNNLQLLDRLKAKSQSIKFIMSTPHATLSIHQPSILGLTSLDQITYTNVPSSNFILNLNVLHIKIPISTCEEDAHHKKMTILFYLIKHRVDKRMVVFSSLKHLESVKAMIKNKLNIHPLEYYSKLNSEKRMSVIFDFNCGRNNLLLTTQLAARGLNFEAQVDTIISFDPELEGQQLMRMGRSNKLGGQYIMLLWGSWLDVGVVGRQLMLCQGKQVILD